MYDELTISEEIEVIKNEIPWCKHFRRDTRQCIHGCKSYKIKPGHKCTFRYPDTQIDQCVSYK
jgi:hypothetical protein